MRVRRIAAHFLFYTSFSKVVSNSFPQTKLSVERSENKIFTIRGVLNALGISAWINQLPTVMHISRKWTVGDLFFSCFILNPSETLTILSLLHSDRWYIPLRNNASFTCLYLRIYKFYIQFTTQRHKHLLIAKGSEGREERREASQGKRRKRGWRKPGGKRIRVTDVLVRNINYHSFCNGNWKKDGNKYINS